MIRLKQLFTPVKSLDAEEGKKYIQDHPEGTFTLLDVRQPGEYEQPDQLVQGCAFNGLWIYPIGWM